jgi:hypothetical protein
MQVVVVGMKAALRFSEKGCNVTLSKPSASDQGRRADPEHGAALDAGLGRGMTARFTGPPQRTAS